jgi:hypothetical protein
MAATGRRDFLRAGSLLLFGVAISEADQASDLRTLLSDIAVALTSGDPASALEPFSKSLPDYNKLRDYFSGLTSAFDIVNEVDVTDEQDSPHETKATVHWVITFTSKGNNWSNQRDADIQVQCVQEKKKWLISGFSPIDVFDPAKAQTPMRTGFLPPIKKGERTVNTISQWIK